MDIARKLPRYGWKPDTPMLGKRQLSLRAARPLKSHYDLEPSSTPCYDQGQTSSCVGHGTAAAWEYVRNAAGLQPPFRPSRLMAYYMARMLEGTTHDDAGAEIHDAFSQIVKFGLAPEWDWEFTPDNLLKEPCAAAWKAAKWHPTIKESVPQSIEAFKTALDAKVPVVCGATLYEGFETPDVDATGMVPMPKDTDKPAGGHCFALWGLDDATKKVKCRNSYGPNWGQRGYFFLDYDYILNPDLADDFQLVRHVAA